MQTLLNHLANHLGHKPFVSDRQGHYHLHIDNYNLFLRQQGTELVLSSPLNWRHNLKDPTSAELLKILLQQVTHWGRYAPQALVLDESENLILEARLDPDNLDVQILEQMIAMHIDLLEQVMILLPETPSAPPWKQVIWQP
ncbi:YscB family type III secretion system chaperone [Photorhabdus heterorhabditis]|uniref:Type III secretion protein n=1 Tax=Photorhabdus heterorhabditis TaxID=880156 RepID=A0ABR5KDK8_9GAMM|nr:YscB family type III secretion system chaperone [Photorhabdus heterorhabditis]KOY62685.1 type III secretion protein [Photorhabdus heterorhabditis]MBS9443705.1 YscB family type III secretion system chaperone [Photorhabdus heterorhabditis]NRN30070.1 YscB family type III secretion system chaperone [Photorhabdus heterorhabditis subsp. aluminescens]